MKYSIGCQANHEKDQLVKSLAVLNLQRNKCIDEIDKLLQEKILSIR